MKPFAMQVRVGRLDNVHCSFGRAGAMPTSLWICASLMMCSLLLCQFGSNAGAEISPDGQLLLDFKDYNEGYLGDCEGDVASWNKSDDTPCAWTRVFCDAQSAVLRLDFSACSLLSSVIFDWLSGLGSLRELDLSSNPGLQLGTDFDGLKQLTGLTWLDVSGIWSSDDFGSFGVFPNLQYLYARGGLYSGRGVFPRLEGLPELLVLSLGDNGLTGGIPEDVSSLTKLRSLDLSHNFLNGSVPSLEGLTHLTHFSLTSNNLSGEVPVAPNLQYLDAAQNGFTNYTASFLHSAHSALLRVNLSGNSLTGTLPSHIDYHYGFPWHSVDLSDNQLQGPLPANFSIPSEDLRLENNQLSGDIVLLLLKLEASLIVMDLFISLRLQGNSFTGDLTRLLDGGGLLQIGPVWDFSHNNFNMTPSEQFSNPLHTLLESLCNDIAFPLEELRLAGSDLMGISLPDRLNCSRPENLNSFQILDLASCNLGGTVPDELFYLNMPNLTFLNLSNNRLSGPIPGRLPITLSVLDLGNTSVEGNLPVGLFTGLSSLLHFNASHNNLSGSIPDSFPGTLRVLDLSHNNLSGEIPGTLFFALLNLRYINLSGNNLSGPNPAGLPQDLNYTSFFADNPGLCGGPLQPCFTPQRPAQRAGGIKVWVLVTVVVAAVFVCMASCLLLVWTWRVYSKKHQQDVDLIATLLERETVTVMPLRELRKATSNFSDSAQIGAGGFGTVYSGELADGTAVAIKKGKREGSPEYKQQFLNEVRILSGVSHRHLVKLLGCSMENKIPLLVFEFVPNGTLKEHLEGTRQGFSPLTWRRRLLIAIQTADALAYLHSAADPPIIHRDIKSCNILLDEDLNAKVADFGISKLAPSKTATHVTTVAIQGTRGYIDPEYYSSFQLTPRSDVYSFGVVLLELISSKPVIDYGRGSDATSLVTLALSAMMERGEWQEFIDPVLADTHSSTSGRASIASVGALAVRCLAPRSRERPEMKEVRNELQTHFLHLDTDASFQSDIVRHSVQPQNENARGDVDTSYDHMSLLSSQSSLWNSSSTSYPETEMQPL